LARNYAGKETTSLIDASAEINELERCVRL